MKVSVTVKRKTDGKESTITVDKLKIKNGIETFGKLINKAESIPLRCGLMIAFLHYAEINGFNRKAEMFVQETSPQLAKRLLNYYNSLHADKSIPSYIESTFKNVWYAKDCTIQDKEVMVNAKSLMSYPKILTFVK